MKQNPYLTCKLRQSGMLIIAGLLIEAMSLLWNHPLSFVAFIALGGLLLVAGVVIYLLALVAPAAMEPPTSP